MRCSNHFAWGISAFVAMVIACLTPAWGQQSSAGNSYYYVANTRLPDAFLALRTRPSSQSGLRIMAMPNGTLLEVLERRADRWWYVRVVPSGEEGWALSGEGRRVWIECCRTGLNDVPQGELVGFKTPSNNIHCQLDEGTGGATGYLRCDIREMGNATPSDPAIAIWNGETPL
jgi:Bacterial SH3 domain